MTMSGPFGPLKKDKSTKPKSFASSMRNPPASPPNTAMSERSSARDSQEESTRPSAPVSRPRLRVQMPSYHIDPKDSNYSTQKAGGGVNNPPASAKPETPKQLETPLETKPGSPLRVWFRKKSGGAATSLMVSASELVDDIKIRILERYPTSLRIKCDPADLTLTLQNHSGLKLELQPDECVSKIVSKFFPQGMKMKDAIEVGPPTSSWANLERPRMSRSASRSIYTHNSEDSSSESIHTQSPMYQTPSSKPPTPVEDSPRKREPKKTNVLLLPKPLPVNHPKSGPNVQKPTDPNYRFHQYKSSNDSESLEQEINEEHEKENFNENTEKELKLEAPLVSANTGIANSATGNVDAKSRKVSGSLWQLQQRFSPSFQLSQQGKVVVVPQINVLIVEDNPVNQRLLEAFMKRKKVRYGLANNGREALEMWKAGGFHLIFMDIQLPVMTGLEATKEIRRLEVVNGIGAFNKKTKQQKLAEISDEDRIKKSAGGFRSPVIIVALTASNDKDDKSDALAAGCNDFLTKPVSFSWLEKKIIEWGCMQALIDYDGWKQWNKGAKDEKIEQIAVTPGA